MIATIAFYLFAALTIAPALAVIFARNPVHSVLWLILAFFNAAGLMLLVEIGIAFGVSKGGPALSGHLVPDAKVPNIVALGQLLYSRYLFAFELAGLILLVAMIGAIVLTHRSRRDSRAQKVWKQIGRRPADAVRNLDPGVGEGMKL